MDFIWLEKNIFSTRQYILSHFHKSNHSKSIFIQEEGGYKCIKLVVGNLWYTNQSYV